jgi:hypothetical protein
MSRYWYRESGPRREVRREWGPLHTRYLRNRVFSRSHFRATVSGSVFSNFPVSGFCCITVIVGVPCRHGEATTGSRTRHRARQSRGGLVCNPSLSSLREGWVQTMCRLAAAPPLRARVQLASPMHRHSLSRSPGWGLLALASPIISYQSSSLCESQNGKSLTGTSFLYGELSLSVMSGSGLHTIQAGDAAKQSRRWLLTSRPQCSHSGSPKCLSISALVVPGGSREFPIIRLSYANFSPPHNPPPEIQTLLIFRRHNSHTCRLCNF